MSHEICPLGPGEDLIDVESFHRLHSGIPGPAPGWRAAPLAGRSALPSASRVPLPGGAANPPANPSEIELLHRLTRQDVERIVVKRARVHADAAAFFLVRRGCIQATYCDPEPPQGLEPIHWTGRRYVLVSVLEQQLPYSGTPWRDALMSRIVHSLGRERVREIALVPIAVYGRPVAFLYADAGRKLFAPRSVAELSSLCFEIGVVFERMIVERKRDPAR